MGRRRRRASARRPWCAKGIPAPVPHGVIGAYDIDGALDAETLDAIALGVVSLICASWNQLDLWLRQIDSLWRIA